MDAAAAMMMDMAAEVQNHNREGFTPFVDPAICNMGAIIFYTCVYGYVLYEASNFISDGGEYLLLVPKIAPIVGSVVLPVLGAVPDGMMVLFSGVGQDPQEELTVGVGTLAGSTIMLLTLPWFIALFAGRVNIEDGNPTYRRPKDAPDDWDKTMPPGNMSLTGTGVGINAAVRRNAKLMLLTLLVFAIIQVPAAIVCLFKKPADMDPDELLSRRTWEAEAVRPFVLIGLIFCILTFFLYLYHEWHLAQGDKKEELEARIANHHAQALKNGRITLRGAMAQFSEQPWVAEVAAGNVDKVLKNKESLKEVRQVCKVLAPFFAHYDINSDSEISFEEFQMVFNDAHECLSKDAQWRMFQQADIDDSGSITFEEFVACCMAFTLDAAQEFQRLLQNPTKKRTTLEPSAYLGIQAPQKRVSTVSTGSGSDFGDEEEGEDEEEEEEEEDMPEDLADLDPEEQQRRLKNRAVMNMAIGGFLTLTFSDPMVDLLSEMAKRMHMSSFYTSFVLAPLTSNASELVASYNIAKKRTLSSIGTSFATLVGAAIMNNTFGLGIFFAVIVAQNLAWEFTAEIISTVVIQLLMGLMIIRSTYMRLLDGLLVIAFYPAAMLLVYVLENVFNIN